MKWPAEIKCGRCAHLEKFHGETQCDQCLVENKDTGIQDPDHKWQELNHLGNRVI